MFFMESADSDSLSAESDVSVDQRTYIRRRSQGNLARSGYRGQRKRVNKEMLCRI